MDIRKLQRAIVDGLEDVKAQNIVVFNTEHLSALFERVIIASGTSNRQTKSLAASVRDAVRREGFPVLRTEGEGNGEWIIVDCGAAVVHVMQPAIREYYHLEEIWGDKPVNVKLGSTGAGKLVKASEEAPTARRATPRAKARGAADPARSSGKAPARPGKAAEAGTAKSPARKAAVSPAANVARKSAAPAAPKGAVTRVTGVKKAPPTRPGVTRSTGVKSATAKSTPLKSTPKSAPAKRVASPAAGKTVSTPIPKKLAAKKLVAKKAAAKTVARKPVARKTSSR